MAFILGRKIGMSQVFEEEGKVIPVTLIEAGPVTVVRIKKENRDGYQSIQVGFEKKRKINKPLKGQLKDLDQFRVIKEFKDQDAAGLDRGSILNVSSFAVGDKVKVSGLSKGKGFQGVVKRHGFHGMPASHGHHHVLRHGGSIGQRFPQHTLKGMRMAGRMGGVRITTRGLKIVSLDKDNNLLALKGAVTGRKGALLEIIKLEDKRK